MVCETKIFTKYADVLDAASKIVSATGKKLLESEDASMDRIIRFLGVVKSAREALSDTENCIADAVMSSSLLDQMRDQLKEHAP